ncbi:MAG: hypothetical protein E7I55_04750 [Acinetobacter ursingii]|nr:hypothetical protein [Acinetobacter ursingii]
MSSKITTPYPLFNDVDGRPLDAGFVFIGEAGKNPEVYPISVFWDENLTVPAEQPIRTRNGYFAKSGRAGKLYVADADCSITVKNKNKIVVHTDLFADLFFGQKDVVKTVESIADLKYLVPWDGRTVYVKSYHLGLGKGGGEFIATQKAGLVDDGGLVVASPDPLLFWVRVNYGSVTPEMFGAVGDNATDDYEPLQAWAFCGRKLYAEKKYRTSRPIELPNKVNMTGLGSDKTSITKYGATTTGITGRTDPNGNPYNYDVDCTVVFGAWYGWHKDLNITGISFIKEKVVGADVGYGFFAPYISLSKFEDMVVYGGATNIYSEDAWMIQWTKVRAESADTNFHIKTGTTNTFNKCWAVGARVVGYNIRNLVYSTMINSTVEYAGTSGSPIEAAYVFTKGNITLISCGCENIHAKAVVATDEGAQVTIIDPSFIMITNNYPNGYYGGGLLTSRHPDDCLRVVGGVLTATNGATPAFAIATRSASYIEVNGLNAEGMQKHYSSSAYRPSLFNGTRGFIRYYSDGELHSLGNYSQALQGGANLSESRKTKDIALIHGDISTGTIANGFPVDSFAGFFLNFSNGNPVVNENNSAQLAMGFNNNFLGYRKAEWGGAYTAWIEARTTANTTVDANGFVKKASPILNLLADRIELNDEAELQPITFEKLGVGDYLVAGSLGFAQEGWYIEMPKDANGNVLVAVVYKQLENNDISIKTYAKKFDDEAGDIVPNLSKPRDIPENRSITLRLQELPKVEQEIVPE